MRLEAAIDGKTEDKYPFEAGKTISLQKCMKELVSDIHNNVDTGIISAKFHNTIISVNFAVAEIIRKEKGINRVVLSGGVFQNKYLLEGTTNILKKNNFEVFSHKTVPSNDGGLALGQLAIAAKRRKLRN
jgi:hydrogenase maturation protein HypF